MLATEMFACCLQAQLAFAKAVDTFAAHQKATEELVVRREDAYAELLQLQEPQPPQSNQLVSSVRAMHHPAALWPPLP